MLQTSMLYCLCHVWVLNIIMEFWGWILELNLGMNSNRKSVTYWNIDRLKYWPIEILTDWSIDRLNYWEKKNKQSEQDILKMVNLQIFYAIVSKQANHWLNINSRNIWIPELPTMPIRLFEVLDRVVILDQFSSYYKRFYN